MTLKVILLGANGQVGTQINLLKPEPVDLFPFTSSELDITDKQSVCREFSLIKPDLIINAAAYTQVDLAEKEKEKAFLVNTTGPENIASCLPQGSRLIHISTDFVFGGDSNQPYQTNSPVNPLGVYGKSKLAGELKITEIIPDSSIIIRTAWVYSSTGKNFVNTMLRLMSDREELSVVCDQRGTPTSAGSLAYVIWLFAARAELSGIYHWTDQGETSWYDFACAIQDIARKKKLLDKKIPVHPISTSSYPTPAKRPAYSVLDRSLTCKALNYEGTSWITQLEAVLDEKR